MKAYIIVLILSASSVWAYEVPWARLPTPEYAAVKTAGYFEIVTREPTLLEFNIEFYEISNNKVSPSTLVSNFLQKACWGECDYYNGAESVLKLKPFEQKVPLRLGIGSDFRRLNEALNKVFKKMRYMNIQFETYEFSDGFQSLEKGVILVGRSEDSGVNPSWLLRILVLQTK